MRRLAAQRSRKARHAAVWSALQQAAPRYAAHGWAVLPLHEMINGTCSCGDDACDSPAKHPRIAKGCSKATTNPLQVTTWWERWPTANIGIQAGRNGIVIADADTPEACAWLGQQPVTPTRGSPPLRNVAGD